MKKYFYIPILLTILFSFPQFGFAHDVVKDLENISKSEAIFTYIKIGFAHILPLGFDHILFIISLVLFGNYAQSTGNQQLKNLFLQSAAFTVGHCFTLGLAMYNVFSISPKIVEPIIALTIIYVAAENIFSRKLKPSRIGLVFLFGLLHGMGFASALSEIGLPQNAYLLSLLMFNLGVELGQITVIVFAYFLLIQIQKRNKLQWARLVLPISIFIISISTYWFFERIF